MWGSSAKIFDKKSIFLLKLNTLKLESLFIEAGIAFHQQRWNLQKQSDFVNSVNFLCLTLESKMFCNNSIKYNFSLIFTFIVSEWQMDIFILVNHTVYIKLTALFYGLDVTSRLFATTFVFTLPHSTCAFLLQF